jgi:hypothetical protein
VDLGWDLSERIQSPQIGPLFLYQSHDEAQMTPLLQENFVSTADLNCRSFAFDTAREADVELVESERYIFLQSLLN